MDMYMKEGDIFEKDHQATRTFILILSSTGEGEPPDNAKRFNREIRKKVGLISKDPWVSQTLSKFQFYILGLGSSEYAKYQGYPKTVISQLTQLGAEMLGEFGQADELKD